MDLLVDEGKVLILQNTDFPDDFSGTDFLEEPNDDANGGTIDFDFIGSVTLIAIDLVDIDASAAATLTLTDSSGLTRTYSVPDEWSGQVPTDTGFATLDLTTLADQSGPGSGGDATAVEDGGFDPDDVMSLVVEFTGSAALNNLLFVPEPTFGLLGLLVSLGFVGANRRKQRTLRMQT